MKNPNRQASGTRDDIGTGHVGIFDTTLRDGEQAPGFALDPKAKLRMAQMLNALGVDLLEAGFPQASPDDFAATARIAETLRDGTTVCALARCRSGDIDRAGRALERAKRSRIHVVISTSPLHRWHKLGMSRAQLLDAAVVAVERTCGLCDEVESRNGDAQ